MANDISELREHLFDTLRGLKNKSIDVDHAKAISEVSQVLINSAKVEVEHIKASGGSGTNFISGSGDEYKGYMKLIGKEKTPLK